MLRTLTSYMNSLGITSRMGRSVPLQVGILNFPLVQKGLLKKSNYCHCERSEEISFLYKAMKDRKIASSSRRWRDSSQWHMGFFNMPRRKEHQRGAKRGSKSVHGESVQDESVHGESFGVSLSFDIPPLAGDEMQDKSVQDESVRILFLIKGLRLPAIGGSAYGRKSQATCLLCGGIPFGWASGQALPCNIQDEFIEPQKRSRVRVHPDPAFGGRRAPSTNELVITVVSDNTPKAFWIVHHWDGL